MRRIAGVCAVIVAAAVAFGASAQTSVETIERKVTDIMVQHLGVDRARVSPDSRLEKDLGADELDLVEIVMELEEKFDVSIPDEEVMKVTTVGDMVALVARLKARH